MQLMRRLALVTALASLIGLPIAFAQQQSPPFAWPDPPGTQTQNAPPPEPAPPPAPKKKSAKKAPKKPPVDETDPRFQEEPAPPPPDGVVPLPEGAAPPKPKTAARPALNILCDGPFAKNASHDQLAKAFGARNVVAQGVPPAGGSTVIFPNDPKRRLEVTWRDPAGRRRPATIVIEGQSTWRARGFRIGDPLAQVEKVNRKPFRLSGFSGDATGGAARNWQDGKLDKLSGGCMLGMRFVPDPKAPADAVTKVASGDLVSDSADIKAVKPMILELILGYPE
jgi:hypothetical protein